MPGTTLKRWRTRTWITPADFVQDVTALLTRAGVFNLGILLFGGLFVADPTTAYFQCTRCSRVHLHRSGGICSGCLTPLGPSRVAGVDDAGQEIDYYRWLAVDAGPIFRLNCAEMTGQTDKVPRATASAYSRTFLSATRWLSPTTSIC